jgi:hypothetical protein
MHRYTEFFTTRETAEFLSVSVPFLELCRKRGDGPPWYRLSNTPTGAVRYRRSALEAWLAGRERVHFGEG